MKYLLQNIHLTTCRIWGSYKGGYEEQVLTAVVMKSTIFWEHSVVRWKSTDVSEENVASIFRVK
jgi:hypothetical protein